MRPLRATCLGVSVILFSCGGTGSSGDGGGQGGNAATGGGTSDAGTGGSGGSALGGGSAAGGGTAATGGGTSATGGGSASIADGGLEACPTAGDGGILAPNGCVMFTPAQAGASATGTNANDVSYALAPAGTARGQLMLYFNASLSHPERQIADPTHNFYNAAAVSGLHVLALSYDSAQIIGAACGSDGGCYEATRKAIVTGAPQTGSAGVVANIQPDEGIVERTVAALAYLAANQPNTGWDQFLVSGATPSAQIVWSKITTAGHSQGGGHAAFVGKLYPVHKVIQFSSTCDAVTASNTPAPWTQDGQWATDPATKFWGFGSLNDGICPAHVAVWQAEGVDASRQNNNATQCASGGGQHGATVGCPENYDTWLTFFTN